MYADSKTIDMLLKSISYFEYKNFRIVGNARAKVIVSQQFHSLQFDQVPYDIIFSNILHIDFFSTVLSDKNHIHNNSLMLLDAIYASRETQRLWNEIKADEKVTVTLDLFYCGIVFFRKEQAKEHFKVRI